jgi:hypothetical protein
MPTPRAPSTPLARRDALGALARLLLAAATPALLPRTLLARTPRTWREVVHPDPRPGITAEHVLPEGEVPERYRDAYRAAREIPEVLDGIFCHCDCAAHRGLRSLLSCYESEMPQSCGICTGEARTAHRMHGRGATLAEIRVAIDRAYGGRDEHQHEHQHA